MKPRYQANDLVLAVSHQVDIAFQRLLQSLLLLSQSRNLLGLILLLVAFLRLLLRRPLGQGKLRILPLLDGSLAFNQSPFDGLLRFGQRLVFDRHVINVSKEFMLLLGSILLYQITIVAKVRPIRQWVVTTSHFCLVCRGHHFFHVLLEMSPHRAIPKRSLRIFPAGSTFTKKAFLLVWSELVPLLWHLVPQMPIEHAQCSMATFACGAHPCFLRGCQVFFGDLHAALATLHPSFGSMVLFPTRGLSDPLSGLSLLRRFQVLRRSLTSNIRLPIWHLLCSFRNDQGSRGHDGSGRNQRVAYVLHVCWASRNKMFCASFKRQKKSGYHRPL